MRKHAGVLAALLMLSSCGAFGPKDESGNSLDLPVSLQGCLDRLGPRLERFAKGDISEGELREAFDCTTDTLKLLNRFGASEHGFTQDQLLSLTRSLLITDHSIPADFMPAVLEVKASLLGGSKETVSVPELDEILRLLGVLKQEALLIRPWLERRKTDRGPETQLGFGRALSAAFVRLSGEIREHGTSALGKGPVEILRHDLSQILEWEIPAYLTDALFAGKVAVLGGSAVELEPGSWKQAMATFGAIGGPLYALSNLDRSRISGDAYGNFLVTVADDVEAVLTPAINRRGGMIPPEDLDRIIDALPPDLLTVAPANLKRVARAATARFLGSSVPGAVEPKTLQIAISELKRWKRGQTAIENAFQELRTSGATRGDLLAALSRTELPVAEARRLAGIVTGYWPLFMGEDDPQISLSLESLYTHNHLTQLHWMNQAAELAIRGYSSAQDRASLSFEDFQVLYADFRDFGIDMSVVDPTVPDFEGRRFRDADSYMPSSDGDGTMSLSEATYYFAYLKSIGALARKVRADTEVPCKVSDIPGALGWLPMSPDCFRTKYFSRVHQYWDHSPAMLSYFGGLAPEVAVNVRHDMEHVARLYGYTEIPMGSYDVKAFVSLLHYAETLFNRFDLDGNGRFDTAETLLLSQIFARRVAKAAGFDPSDTAKIEAVFTYVIKHGKAPQKDAWGVVQVGAWLAARPFWNIDAPRADVYKGLSVFVSPLPPPQP